MNKPKRKIFETIDMEGQRVGPLTVGKMVSTHVGNVRWHCTCECGRSVMLEGIDLRARLKRLKSNPRSTTRCGKGCTARRGLEPTRKADEDVEDT